MKLKAKVIEIQLEVKWILNGIECELDLISKCKLIELRMNVRKIQCKWIRYNLKWKPKFIEYEWEYKWILIGYGCNWLMVEYILL